MEEDERPRPRAVTVRRAAFACVCARRRRAMHEGGAGSWHASTTSGPSASAVDCERGARELTRAQQT